MAYRALEDMQIYRDAERYSDRIYALVHTWNSFDSSTVGTQLVRAADSVGANIAESHGRFHYGERVHFFYYARGSAYETIYWLKRAGNRSLLSTDTVENAVVAYTDLVAALNRVIKSTKQLRSPGRQAGAKSTGIAETTSLYSTGFEEIDSSQLPF